jgi:hypothetical protein
MVRMTRGDLCHFTIKIDLNPRRSEALQEEISCVPQYLLTHCGIWQQASNFDCPDHCGKDRKESPFFVRGSPARHERDHSALIVHQFRYDLRLHPPIYPRQFGS